MKLGGTKNPRALLLLLLLLLLFVATTVRTAWVCDDAYITFRTVDNLLNGHGPTWNVSERVQTYTHPLWMMTLTLAHLVTGEPFYTSIFLCIAAAAAAIFLLALRIGASTGGALLAVAALTFSRAFVDYSTSGLENSLTHLLLALFLLSYFTPGGSSVRKLFQLSLIAALGILNRMDTALIYLPPLVYAFTRVRPRGPAARAILIGLLPIIIWEIFSLFYYGMPLPNTAYAKLNTGIPVSELVTHGGLYFQNSLRLDPLTLFTIAVGVVLPFIRRQSLHLPLSLGLLLYLLYILRIGGDFMSGRFFAAPIFCAAVIISRQRGIPRRLVAIALMIILIVGAVPRILPVIGGEPERTRTSPVGADGIADERVHYAADGALFRPRGVSGERGGYDAARGRMLREGGPSIVVEGAIGVLGYHAGPETHILDVLALGDPLLARLPAVRFDPNFALIDPRPNNWRIGHFLRALPPGYLETVMTGENQLRDERLAAYYNSLSLITRGRLFSRERLTEILRVNLGGYEPPADLASYRDPHRVMLADLGPPTARGEAPDPTRLVPISFNGVRVTLPAPIWAPRLQIALGAGHVYLLVYYWDDVIVGVQPVVPRGAGSTSLVDCVVDVPKKSQKTGFDTIGVFPMKGNGQFVVGPIAFLARERGSATP